MSSPQPKGPSVSADADERSNRMSIEITQTPHVGRPLAPAPTPAPAPRPHQSPYTFANLLQDYFQHLPALAHLPPSDVLVLLTPVVIPITHDPDDICDPFEPLGRALATRHAKIRHVPYTNRNGVTSTHVGFIKRASVLVMVISDLSLFVGPRQRGEDDVSEPEEREEEFLQIRFAAIARAAFANYGDRERPRERPFILVVTCPLTEKTRKILETSFGTVLTSKGYSKPALESTASLIFRYHGMFTSTSRTEGARPDREPASGAPPPTGQQENPPTGQQSLTLQVTRPKEAIKSPAIASQPLRSQSTLIPGIHTEVIPPKPKSPWIPEQWDETTDLIHVFSLWNQTMDPRFKIPSEPQLASLLNRTGYARHYVVRSPSVSENGDGQILGFAATYLTYIDQEGEKLLGSVAILLVDPAFRNKGIGTSLHHFAINQLKDTMGVRRLQLGSLWPRILFGPLCRPHSGRGDVLSAEKVVEEEEKIMRWFRKRGWNIAPTVSSPSRTQVMSTGHGKAVHDLLLPFSAWKPIVMTPNASAPTSRRTSTSSPKSKKQRIGPSPETMQERISNEKAEMLRLMKSQITFRPCTQADMASVLGLIDEVADVEGDNMGWYDQYSRLSNEIYVKDIIVATITSSASSAPLNPASIKGKGVAGRRNGVGDGVGVERTRLVGCALTYTPASGNPVAGDLPWAGMGAMGVGSDVGGVCCVCVSATVDRESLMIGLLDACVQSLQEQGMKRLFLDTVRNHLEWFEELGFIEWARYRDVWRDVEPESEDDGEQSQNTEM